MPVADDLLVDALPYIDQGYDDAARDAALELIEEECKRYRPTKNYLDNLPPPKHDAFETEIMRNEFERLQNRLPMELLNMKRYELPAPPAGKLTDITAWSEAVANAQAQLEHQETRLANLDVMSAYGAETWKAYNAILKEMLDYVTAKLTAIRKEIQQINYERKQKQTDVGDKLSNLESTWVGLVTKNYEIERAIVDIETELTAPRKKKRKLA